MAEQPTSLKLPRLDELDRLRVEFLVSHYATPGGWRVMDSITGKSFMGFVSHNRQGDPIVLTLDTPRFFGHRLRGSDG